MNTVLSGVPAPLVFPSQLTAPVKQRKPHRLPAGVASFAEHAGRRYRVGAGFSPASEVAAQRYALSAEDKRFLKIMIRAYQEQIADLTCQLIRAGEVDHG